MPQVCESVEKYDITTADSMEGFKEAHYDLKLCKNLRKEIRKLDINELIHNDKKKNKGVINFVHEYDERMPSFGYLVKKFLKELHKEPISMQVFPAELLQASHKCGKNLYEWAAPYIDNLCHQQGGEGGSGVL